MKKLSLLLIFLFFFQASSAIMISEIMFDLEGTDENREWIEIYNNEDKAVDLTGWKLYEAETNHRLTLKQGSAVIESKEYAIISDNSEQFIEDNPDFSGNLFDSAFSLSNKGETLILRNPDKTDINSATYSSSDGAKGDGNSLQFVDEEWCVGEPTIGEDNSCNKEPKQDIEDLATSEPEVPPILKENPQSEDEGKEQPKEAEPIEEEVFIVEETKTEIEKEPIPTQPKQEAEITGAVIYTSEQSSNANYALYLLLAVSIALNALFILSSIINRRA